MNRPWIVKLHKVSGELLIHWDVFDKPKKQIRYQDKWYALVDTDTDNGTVSYEEN